MSHSHDHPHPEPAPAARPPEPPVAPLEDAGALALEEALSSSFKVLRILMVLLVVAFAGSGMFTVNPNEVAVVLRFGKPAGVGAAQILRPGLHFALPYPIDEIVRLPVGQSITVVSSNGWHSFPEGAETSYNSLRPGVDGYMLTGDGNIIHSRATLKYRLQPETAMDYYFHFTNPTNTLRAALENSLVYASSRSLADTAVFGNLTEFNDLAKQRLNQILEQIQLRISIDQLEVENRPPPMVHEAFNELATAQQKADTEINKAEADARVITNSAVSQAQVLLNEATTRSNQLVLTVQAEAKAFSDQLGLYQANPELFKQRLLTETMQQILAGARDKFFVPARADGRPREVRLQLNREPLSERGGE